MRVRHRRDVLSLVGARELCHWLLACLVGLNVGDLITTRAVLNRGGAEANPLMQGIVNDALHATSVKLLCLVVVTTLVSRTSMSQRIVLLLGAVNFWYAVVVCWNLALVART